MRNSFGLAPGARPFEMIGRDAMRSGRRFMDYAVDGRPLLERLAESARGSLADDMIPVLVYDWSPDDAIDVLLGVRPGELEDGRIPLYTCPECADLGCGAITAVVERNAKDVTWHDFGYQNDHEPFDDDGRLSDMGPFEFDRVEYEAAFADFRAGWSTRAAERAAAARTEVTPRKRLRFRLFRGGRSG